MYVDLYITDVNECATGDHPCDLDVGECVNVEGSVTCECQPGYRMEGTTCVREDECALGTDNCAMAAICIDTLTSFTCNCRDGYNGNGRTCDGKSRLIGDVFFV